MDIYQTFNPGAITQIDLILPDETRLSISNSADPGTPCPGILSVSITTEAAVIGAVLYLDQTITGNWNEIDAVQMTGTLAVDPYARQWASGASATSQYGEESWSAFQATGSPNTSACGDQGTAWASASSIGKDSLTVTFDEAVIPSAIHIYQTYNPGAITGIQLVPANGSDPITVTGSADPGNVPCPGIMMVDILEETVPVNGVIIHLDQSLTGNWNEIDAVKLIGKHAG